MKKTNYIIQVQNTTDIAVVPEKSLKADKENHGFGLESVRLLANKHDGDLYLEIKEKVFTAIVSVQL